MAEYALGILHWLGNRTIDINLEILVCLNCLLSESGFSGLGVGDYIFRCKG